MKLEIPGTELYPGREYIYIEDTEGILSRALMSAIFLLPSGYPLPKSGGVLEERAKLVLRNGTTFFGYSFKGDLDGLRTIFHNYCKNAGKKWAVIDRGKLLISDGREVALDEINVVFE